MEFDGTVFRTASEPLLAWFRENARDLPWRHTRDPYRIWVSEIMLQQTRVGAVLGYYDRFLQAFPTVEDLAAGSEERLLSLWQGLGYYSRARNLKRAAEQAAEQGGFPRTRDGLLSLPGIGEYTAGAIASAAFGLPCGAVDGNVLRVAARLTDYQEPVTPPPVRKAVQTALEAAFPAGEAAYIFNQAWMELGAVVCVPNGPPKCGECPVSALCLGRARGTAERLPVREAKRPRRVEQRTVFLLVRGNRAAVRKRAARGLLAGLWEFPNVAGRLDEAEAGAVLARWGLSAAAWENRLEAKHIFTHVEWHMRGYVLRVRESADTAQDTQDTQDARDTQDTENAHDASRNDFQWLDRRELSEYAIPSAFARFRERAWELLEPDTKEGPL